MGAVEKIRQKQHEEEEKKNPSPASKGPTLKQIKSSDEQSRLFGMYLEKEGKEELGRKFAQDELTEETTDALAAERDAFAQVAERIKTIDTTLNGKTPEGKQMMSEILARSPELAKIAGRTGPEAIKSVITKQLWELALNDEEHFKKIEEGITDMLETRTVIEKDNKIVEALCKKYGIKEDAYLEALQSDDSDAALKKLVKDKLGFWSRVAFGTRRAVNQLDNKGRNLEVLQKRAEELDEDMAAIGSALRLTIYENDTVNEALENSLKEEPGPEAEPTLSMSEFKDASKKFKLEYDKAWKDYEARHRDDVGYDGYAAQTTLRKNFAATKSKNAFGGKKGFWANIFSAPYLESMLK